ncbi:hypothetical protein FRC02_005916 [Tulasnella sp. 418]|nr:hypothetical protein FRC02_005916 [Tulasnella sp. 418]
MYNSFSSASFWTKTPTLTSIPDHSDNGQPPRNILDEGLVMRKAPPSSRTATDGVDHVDGPVFVDDHQNTTQLQYTSVYELKPLEVHDGNELQTRLENSDALSTSQYKSLGSHTPPLPLPGTADTRTVIGDDKPAASSPVSSTSTYLLDLFYDEHDLYCDDDPRNDESSDSMSIGSSMEEEETLNNSLDAQPITSDFEGVATGMGEDFPQPLYVVPEDVEMAEDAEMPEDVEMPDRQEADPLLSLSGLHLHDQEMEVDSALESFKIPSGLTSSLATDCVPMDLDPVEPRDVEMEIASFPAQAIVISASGRPVKPFKPRLQGIHATMNQGSGLLGGMCTTSSEINEEIASTVSPSIPRFPALLKGRRTVNLRRSRK